MTTVAAMLAARAEDDRTGVMDAGGRWTWREAVREGATRGALARSLFDAGAGKPHIGVLLPNGPEYLFWLNGAALAARPSSGSTRRGAGEALAADVRATDCAVIVTDADGAALLEGLDLGVGRRQGPGHRDRALRGAARSFRRHAKPPGRSSTRQVTSRRTRCTS